jgi:hypothetical protein
MLLPPWGKVGKGVKIQKASVSGLAQLLGNPKIIKRERWKIKLLFSLLYLPIFIPEIVLSFTFIPRSKN